MKTVSLISYIWLFDTKSDVFVSREATKNKGEKRTEPITPKFCLQAHGRTSGNCACTEMITAKNDVQRHA